MSVMSVVEKIVDGLMLILLLITLSMAICVFFIVMVAYTGALLGWWTL